METLSAEGFLKSLKASNGVELAISAWANENLYMPSKAQILTTWALNALLKNENVISDSRYWTLLHSILLDNNSSSSALWLPTIVYKTPVVPILTAALRSFAMENGQDLSKEALEPRQHVLRLIAPIAYPKTRLDTVLDCFWATLDAIADSSQREDMHALVNLAVEGFTAAFAKTTNKIKVSRHSQKQRSLMWSCAIDICELR